MPKPTQEEIALRLAEIFSQPGVLVWKEQDYSEYPLSESDLDVVVAALHVIGHRRPQ